MKSQGKDSLTNMNPKKHALSHKANTVNIKHSRCVKKKKKHIVIVIAETSVFFMFTLGTCKVQNVLPTKCLYETRLSTQQ